MLMKKLDTLTDKLSQKTSVNQYKKDSYRITKSVKDIISLIHRNEFDWTNPVHIRKLNQAIKLGFVDENLNILKEV